MQHQMLLHSYKVDLMFRVSCLLGLLPMFLSGCIGTAILFESDEDLTAPFPDLHCVPDKPKCPNMKKYKKVEEELACGREGALMQNQQLREQFKLDTTMPSKPDEDRNKDY